jgi:hypothetical protein
VQYSRSEKSNPNRDQHYNKTKLGGFPLSPAPYCEKWGRSGGGDPPPPPRSRLELHVPHREGGHPEKLSQGFDEAFENSLAASTTLPFWTGLFLDTSLFEMHLRERQVSAIHRRRPVKQHLFDLQIEEGQQLTLKLPHLTSAKHLPRGESKISSMSGHRPRENKPPSIGAVPW